MPLSHTHVPPVPKGVLAPTGYFDPLGVTRSISDETFQKYRESELKHGRVAMLAAIGMLTAEVRQISPCFL